MGAAADGVESGCYCGGEGGEEGEAFVSVRTAGHDKDIKGAGLGEGIWRGEGGVYGYGGVYG